MSSILTIYRDKSFDASTLFGRHLESENITTEEDRRILACTEIDLDMVELVSMLDASETNGIPGTERIRRIREWGYIPLDVRIWEALFFHQTNLIPESWKNSIGGHDACIFFDGTQAYATGDPHNSRCGLWMSWLTKHGSPRWTFGVGWHDVLSRRLNVVSAVLPSNQGSTRTLQ